MSAFVRVGDGVSANLCERESGGDCTPVRGYSLLLSRSVFVWSLCVERLLDGGLFAARSPTYASVTLFLCH